MPIKKLLPFRLVGPSGFLLLLVATCFSLFTASPAQAGFSISTVLARPTLAPSSMVRSGALTQEQVIETRTPNREVPVTGFDFRATDKTISQTITRWGRSTNYEIVWDVDPSIDAPVNGDAMLAASSMKEALDKVVIALQKKGYDVQATAYSNRVIHFTRGNK